MNPNTNATDTHIKFDGQSDKLHPFAAAMLTKFPNTDPSTWKMAVAEDELSDIPSITK